MKASGLILFCLFFFSCSYRYVPCYTTDGKKKKCREYKNHDKQEAYAAQLIFKYQYKEVYYPKYTGTVLHDTANEGLYFQFDTARIYLSKEASIYTPLFLDGVLYTQQFYCALDTECVRPLGPMVTEGGKAVNFSEGMHFYIYTFEEPAYLRKSPQKRRFKIAIPFFDGEYIIFIELTNNTVHKYVNIEEFAKNARLTFIIFGWDEV